MKFTLAWLRDHLDTSASLGEICDKLTLIGLEVESVVDRAADLAAFSIARIVEAKPHPQADRLRICTVEAIVEGQAQSFQVICGAANAVTGLHGVFVPAGAIIPATGKRLERAAIRGIESQGMLCSEWELGVSDDHDNIIEIIAPPPLGTSFAEYAGLDDPVIEIAITPNRGDCLGVHGIARDLAAAGLGVLREEAAPILEESFACPLTIDCVASADETMLCSAFAGRVIRGLENGLSPDWLRLRLLAIGQRSINRIVDITNYLTFDRGRPLHAYDGDRIGQHISARPARGGENLDALDGKTYCVEATVAEKICVIADDQAVLGFGGIIGGRASATENETTTILLESALFDAKATARSGRLLGIESDARYRFERQVDPAYVLSGLDRAAAMIVDLCGGTVSRRCMGGEIKVEPRCLAYHPDEVGRLTGHDVAAAEQRRILTQLGFTATDTDTGWNVAIPSWRADVTTQACLVEEVVRIDGYDRVAATPLPRAAGVVTSRSSPRQSRDRKARRVLATHGFVEILTWSFIAPDEAARFATSSPRITITNPLSRDQSVMRATLMPGLLTVAAQNQARARRDFALFELGPCFTAAESGGQEDGLCGLRLGAAGRSGWGRHWRNQGVVDVHDVKADCLAVLEEIGISTQACRVTMDAPAWYHPGRSGVLRLGPKNMLAIFGEIAPDYCDDYGLTGPVMGFEIYLDKVPLPRRKSTTQREVMALHDLHPVRRDLALIVAATVPAQDILAALRSALRRDEAEISLFDVFVGSPLAAEEKSLGVEIAFQPKTRSLTDAEIQARMQAILDVVMTKTGARLR